MNGKLLKDPLIHFLLVGAAIFAVSLWLNPPEAEDTGRITITADEVAKIRNSITLVQGREATDAEVDAVVEATVREEVLYREGLAQGLDQDDTIVRNRLIEKMRFLTDNVGEPAPPSPAELEAHFATHAARYIVPASVTFEHVFFGAERRGERAQADATAALPGLRRRTDPLSPEALARLGDPLPLWNRYNDMPARDVALAFGDEFAAGVAGLEAGSWQGPVRSRFGWHLVRIVDRTDERQPALDEVRDAVQAAIIAERRAAENEARYRAMRERYEVVIESQPAGAPAADAS